MKKICIALFVSTLFFSCNITTSKTHVSNIFVKRFIVGKNFNGTVLVVWDFPSVPPIKLIKETGFYNAYNGEEEYTVALINVPANGILFTSTKIPENKSFAIEFYEKELPTSLINEFSYKVHPSSGHSVTRSSCLGIERPGSFIYDAFYVSKRFYKYPDEDEEWKKEAVQYGRNSEIYIDSICETKSH